MSAVEQPRIHHDTEAPYFLPSVANASEWERLDEMHKGIATYFGRELSFANITTDVKKVLEIGCGSGAWAIQAAETYPDAAVTAIDIAPLPPRPLPKNLVFQKVDVTKGFPFEPETFDIVHARSTLVHVPHWETVLQNMITLLKPGGWMLVEDVDFIEYDDKPEGVAPAAKKWFEMYRVYLESKGVVSAVGSKVGPVLEETKLFSKPCVNEIRCPFNCKCDGANSFKYYSTVEVLKYPYLDPRTSGLVRAMAGAFRKVTSKSLGIDKTIVPQEVTDNFWREVDNPENDIYMKVYVIWAQKHA